MNKIIKNIFIIIVILIFLAAFSPSYTSLNIDNLAYVIAIGIDKGESSKFKISFQFTTGSSSSESGSSGEKSPLIINSVEADSIESAINLMDSYMARQLNMSHCRLIIFSEEVAGNGIANEIYTLANNPEVRSSANIIVSKNNAKEYIENSKPILENLITKYYEIFPTSSKYTGYVYNASLGLFFNNLISETCEPFAILGGVNDNTTSGNTSSQNSDIANIKSTDTSFSAQRGSENIGVAVFKDDKLIGELSALETLCLSIIRKEVNSFLITIKDPQNHEETIDIMLYEDNSNTKIDIVNNTPYIKINLKFIGRIYSMKENSKYLNKELLSDISYQASTYLENILTDYLYKTSTTFKSDINDLGKYCMSNFLTIPEFEEFNWEESYKNSTFKVTVNANVESGSLMIET